MTKEYCDPYCICINCGAGRNSMSKEWQEANPNTGGFGLQSKAPISDEQRSQIVSDMNTSRGGIIASTEVEPRYAVNHLAKRIHRQNKAMGWWDNPREMGTLLCLVHSEISEAMEGERKGLMDDHLPHRSMLEVELADAMIRILDIAASRNLDVGGAIEEKLVYNRHRADHQPGARAEAHGKKF